MNNDRRLPQATPHLGGRMGWAEERRAQIERVKAFLIQPNQVAGFTEVSFEVDAGDVENSPTSQEALVDVVFPVWFVDKPALSFGGELVRDIVTTGSFPTVSVVVVSWTKEHDVRVGGGYYSGARLAIVVSGRPAEQMIVHWQFTAKAITGGPGFMGVGSNV